MSDDDGWVNKYFGPPSRKKEWEVQVDAPVGELCLFCEEPIAADDTGEINGIGQIWHYECMLRSVIGSVGHLRKECTCYKPDGYHDPPDMSPREAAIAALHEFERQQAAGTWTP